MSEERPDFDFGGRVGKYAPSPLATAAAAISADIGGDFDRFMSVPFAEAGFEAVDMSSADSKYPCRRDTRTNLRFFQGLERLPRFRPKVFLAHSIPHPRPSPPQQKPYASFPD